MVRISLESRGALIKVDSLEQACELSNRIAPEHLELSVADPDTMLPQIRHAGAIFMGRFTPEALGDWRRPVTCQRPVRRGSRRRWVCMISRSALR